MGPYCGSSSGMGGAGAKAASVAASSLGCEVGAGTWSGAPSGALAVAASLERSRPDGCDESPHAVNVVLLARLVDTPDTEPGVVGLGDRPRMLKGPGEDPVRLRFARGVTVTSGGSTMRTTSVQKIFLRLLPLPTLK